MKSIGIDLSLRSTGLACIYEDDTIFKLIQTDKKNLDNEQLLIYNAMAITEFISNYPDIEQINLEGLSFNSLSGSKDIIAGNLWHIRVIIYQSFPGIPVNIIPVTSWRSPLFNKLERDEMKEAKENLKLLAKDKNNKILKWELKRAADIKHQTYLKLPIHIQDELKKDIDNGIYDLSDAYFIAQFKYVPKVKKQKVKKVKGL